MPFRARVKRAFGRSGSQSDTLSLQKTISSRKDSSVYQPGEPMPQSKYRGQVCPKHKAKLESFAFSFADCRRRSTASLYSPMGSKLPSRSNSVNGLHRTYNRGASHFGKVDESADDHGDIANVGGTRNHSIDTPPLSDSVGTKDTPEHHEYAQGDESFRPMSEAELSSALEKLRTRMIMNQDG